MRRRRFGLRTKFIVLIVGLLTAAFSIITVVTLQINTSNLREGLRNQARSFAELATKPIGDTYSLYSDSGRVKIGQQVDRFLDLAPIVSDVVVYDAAGKKLFDSVENSSFSINAEEAAAFKPIYVTNNKGELVKVIAPYIEDNGAHRYTLAYQISNATINSSIKKLTGFILLFSLIATAVSIGVMFLLVNQLFLKPLRRVSELALAISAGQLDQKIQLDRQDEIGDVADSVNTMAESLKADIKKLKEVDALKSEFMIIASHNLRTPLTVISGYLEVIRSMKVDDKIQKMVDAMKSGSDRLNTFAEEMLTIARLEADSGAVMLDLKPSDLAVLIKKIAANFQPMADLKKLRFAAIIPDEKITVHMSQEHIEQAITNLLDNAKKFTDEGGSILLRLSRDDQQALIEVVDTGIGIRAEEQAHLFTKFHRGTDILKYQYEGTGLGLYVTKLIVDEHKGSITVSSQPGHGSHFAVRLPLANTTIPASTPPQPTL